MIVNIFKNIGKGVVEINVLFLVFVMIIIGCL